MKVLSTTTDQARAGNSSSLLGRAWRRTLGRMVRLHRREAEVEYRGFQVSDQTIRDRLEGIGHTFIAAFNFAISCDTLRELDLFLQHCSLAERGFAYEGAGMALAVTDLVTPRSNRFHDFLQEYGSKYEYLLWVGYGWAFARIPGRHWRRLGDDLPLEKWLTFDGYGFHQGYFDSKSAGVSHIASHHLDLIEQHLFHQGLGRSLWFSQGGHPANIQACIHACEWRFQGDLWSGVGLAATYACGASEFSLHELRERAGQCKSMLAQGAAFAAEARLQGENIMLDNDIACKSITGLDCASAAAVALACRPQSRNDINAYQDWRNAIQTYFR